MDGIASAMTEGVVRQPFFFFSFFPDEFRHFFQKYPKKFIRNAEITVNIQLNLVKFRETCKLRYNNVLHLRREIALSGRAAGKGEFL